MLCHLEVHPLGPCLMRLIAAAEQVLAELFAISRQSCGSFVPTPIRCVIEDALLRGAVALVFAHNHPKATSTYSTRIRCSAMGDFARARRKGSNSRNAVLDASRRADRPAWDLAESVGFCASEMPVRAWQNATSSFCCAGP